MEVQSNEAYVFHPLSLCNSLLHLVHGNAELVLCQSCGNVGVCMRAHVRVDAEGHPCHLTLGLCELVDNLQLCYALYIEAEDVVVESEIYLPVALAYSGIYYLRWCEPCFYACLNLSTAYAVGTKAGLADDVQNSRVGIGLNGIMHAEVLMLACLVVDAIERLAQQLAVVVVEWRLYATEPFYGEITFHVC